MYPQQEGPSYSTSGNLGPVSGLGVPVRESELTREISRLHRLTDTLQKRTAELENRLGPVMRGSEPEKSSDPQTEEAVHTPTGVSIRDCRRKVENTLAVLGSVTRRLEI